MYGSIIAQGARAILHARMGGRKLRGPLRNLFINIRHSGAYRKTPRKDREIMACRACAVRVQCGTLGRLQGVESVDVEA